MRTRTVALLLAGWLSAPPSHAADPLPSPPVTPEQITKTSLASVVKITQFGREGVSGMGSGFVISEDGLIATNRHVIGEARRIQVETPDGRQHPVLEIYASDLKLDLAILRVQTPGLPPLALADSDAARQAEPIVAIGHPAGLTYSVVSGLISDPARDVEGVPMIQVAVPIEPGNSGGPVFDRNGRVLGLLTLKSARTENLGFAMPSNALKALLEKPNPIPIQRWMTLGALNSRLWTTRFGSEWSQRAGVIHVSQPGSGFGGRSLCLWNPLPAREFEAEVSVRLESESGAAGLAFCAADSDCHYGFYPSGGRLRLTRFDGPDVFSWAVLAELDSAAYQPGQWNLLRVSVSDNRIRCFVNNAQVVDLEEHALRGGRAGLCKFRTTSASFKQFRVAASLPALSNTAPDPALQSELVRSLLPEQDPAPLLEKLLLNPAAGRTLLEKRRTEAEREAALLRTWSSELHRRSIRESLAAQLARPDAETNLFECALLLARHDNPELEAATYEDAIQQMAEELREDPALSGTTSEAARRISRFLFEENGFHGSRTEFHHRSNSYINEVLDDREGLPITLSVLFLELAQRLHIPRIEGIPLPGRFMVGFRDADEEPFTLLDVFNGAQELSVSEAIASVSASRPFPQKALAPASKRAIVIRMIQNLLAPYSDSRTPDPDSLPYLDLILALEPNSAGERFSRAMLNTRAGKKQAALLDVDWLLEHLPDHTPEEHLDRLLNWRKDLQR
jgi:serine protease Do